MKQRGIILSDLHCGHLVGLTPPAWQIKEPKHSRTKRAKWAVLEKALWGEYKKILKKFEPYDFCLTMGDLVDGAGWRSGGSELITTSQEEQCDMAVACLDQVRLHANKGFRMRGVYGTGYHTGTDDDWENSVADKAGFKSIGSHDQFDINGCVIDIKHDCGASSIPHGRHTAGAKEHYWNVMYADEQLAARADLIIRGHVHYYAFEGGPDWAAMTMPALQGMGTKFGARKCSGVVHWGAVILDVDSKGGFDWHAEIVKIPQQKMSLSKL